MSHAADLVAYLGCPRGSQVYAVEDDEPGWKLTQRPSLDAKAIKLRAERGLRAILPEQEDRYSVFLANVGVLVRFVDGSTCVLMVP